MDGKIYTVNRFGKNFTGKDFNTDYDACEYAKIESRKIRNRNIVYRVRVPFTDSEPIFEYYMNGWFVESSEYSLPRSDIVKMFTI